MLTAKQVNEWQQFYREDPFGDQRADLRSAIVAQRIAGAFSKKVPDLEKFMPFSDKRQTKASEKVREFFIPKAQK